MWSYYGAKTNIVKYYPPPKYDKIIEPFAGTARYALKYFDHDVLLVDKYDVIIKIWKWLQKCSPNDILTLPRFFKKGQSIDEFKFDCEEAKYLIGFLLGYSTNKPRKIVTIKLEQRPNFINYSLKRIASNIFKIRHWKIELGTYEKISNQKATWFIDPPYLNGGNSYVENYINFNQLSIWCQNREGQIIVCESGSADWLPFKPFVKQKTRTGWQNELIYTNEKTEFDNIQLKLFE